MTYQEFVDEAGLVEVGGKNLIDLSDVYMVVTTVAKKSEYTPIVFTVFPNGEIKKGWIVNNDNKYLVGIFDMELPDETIYYAA